MDRKRKDQPRQIMEALEGRTMLSGMFGGSPSMFLSDSWAYEGNVGNRNNMTFRVDISSAPLQVPIMVQYETIDGTAKAGTDYVSRSGSATFAVGETTATFTVPLIGNARNEGNRSFAVRIFNAPAVAIERDTAIGVIVDDDLPIVAVKATQPTASAIGPVNGTVRFTRSTGLTSKLVVSYTVSGTAKPGVDYTKLSGSATIRPGNTYVDVPIKPITSSHKIGTKTVIITTKSGSTYYLGKATKATVNITNKETVSPTARLTSNPGIAAASEASYRFTAVYSDNVAMNLNSVVTGNLTVTGPNGYSQLATLVSRKLSTNGKSITAVYSVPGPGGGWDATDNGTYTIPVVANQVKDTAGNAVTAGGLGTFVVAVA